MTGFTRQSKRETKIYCTEWVAALSVCVREKVADKATEQVYRDVHVSKWCVYLSDDTKREIRDIHLASEVDVWVASGSYIIILLSAALWWPANRALLPLTPVSVCCYSAPCQRSSRVAHCTNCYPLQIRLPHLHPFALWGQRTSEFDRNTWYSPPSILQLCLALDLQLHTHFSLILFLTLQKYILLHQGMKI